MGSIIFISIICLIFIVLGVAISKYKCYWLISGYNTQSKEEKARVDIEKVAKHMGRMCYLIAFIIFIGAIVSDYFEISIIPFVIILIIIIFGYLIYLQRFDHNKKSKAEIIVMIVIGFITFSILIITFSFGNEPNDLIIKDEAIVIDGSYGTTLKRKDIKSIELVDDIPEIGIRSNGYSDGGVIKKGDFKLKSGEKVKLYIQSNKGPYIKISTINFDVYINYKDVSLTKQSFNNLK
ncbi:MULTISPECIES: DUF3784 domain-containing protein [Clostridium]|jgi:hypothetical protein|uniref:DUF3784 domain-containing protein n=1 Tax=Clostridium TaxID=1485 RepID=UPI00019AFD91|nr:MULTISPECIES: DUF3784 domain-containing protein [Clostridium]EEH97491.1 hypothetical protein CSBG_01117 [Clostridium sp. 7_2_43FAA]MBS5306272.1 DUF3784 domain-containing protein [Clostridium sp.]MBS5884907.1 DUF3784 domain-containing protein [Clostridium sp.]MDB1933412.1 DUF3784 domain-containing protein [Clostridium tertium]MDB1937440.1 DUF3784 domain-containing protein [Clostridium tertium]